MLSDPTEIKHPGPRGKHFWAITIAREADWEVVQEWLRKNGVLDDVQVLTRWVHGWAEGKTLLIPYDQGYLVTSMQMKFL